MYEAAQKRLKSAKKESNPLELGYAHLEVAYTLFQNSTDLVDVQKDSKKALAQADQAIESFSGIPFPGGVAIAHLARAAIYTELAKAEVDEQKKAAGVDRALTACIAAQDALNAEGAHTGQFFDIYSSVSVLLLFLREMIEDEEFQKLLDELITTNSTLLGEVVAEDVKLRDEGGSILFTAQLLGVLAELEEDEVERNELLETKKLLAFQSGLWLRETSDAELLDQALQIYQETRSVINVGVKSPEDGEKDINNCSQCGNSNPPGAKFCNECGAAQKKVG